jgi:peptide-methionine (R)-S-oxide reductase
MLARRRFLVLSAAMVSCLRESKASAVPPAPVKPAIDNLPPDPPKVDAIDIPDEKWKEILDPASYDVLRKAGTERAFTGRYWDLHDPGIFACAGCGLNLFDSADKFDSGTGWPSFTKPLKADRVSTTGDASLGMARTEVRCARCAGHLGHVFDDGPPPTHQRYCMNSVALAFRPR